MRADVLDAQTRSIILQSEMEGLPPMLAGIAAMRKLNRRLKQGLSESQAPPCSC